VLIESGSNGNSLIRNDCTHGGDGIFVRVLNGWCSTGNLFEKNDCSYANNNGIECWAQENTFVSNTANHCSYGFWMGGSDKTRLINNEASFNGLSDGQHNSPHLPEQGHAGIVFMFGPSSHTLVRGNRCEGNNGAGIAIVGDLASRGQKWKAWHWVVDGNHLIGNRWGIYAKHAAWLVFTANQFENNQTDKMLDEDVLQVEDRDGQTQPVASGAGPLRLEVQGPASVMAGTEAEWRAIVHGAASAQPLSFQWDLQQGLLRTGPGIRQRFNQPGFYRLGVNVTVGQQTELAWRDVYVVGADEVSGTEGELSNWTLTDFQERVRSAEQKSRMQITADHQEKLVGNSSLGVTIDPYAGFRVALKWTAPMKEARQVSDQQRLSFWLKSINEDVTGWQGGPFLTLHGALGEECLLEPAEGRDLMRELDDNEGRDGWRLFEIPLGGDTRWNRIGKLPATVTGISLSFDSWGAPPLKLWIDGLNIDRPPQPAVIP
jgi:parallel beta-helix repeat protein